MAGAGASGRGPPARRPNCWRPAGPWPPPASLLGLTRPARLPPRRPIAPARQPGAAAPLAASPTVSRPTSLRPARPPAGKKAPAKREAGDKPAAKEPKKAKKEVKEAPVDADMADAEAIVGSGRQAAQVTRLHDRWAPSRGLSRGPRAWGAQLPACLQTWGDGRAAGGVSGLEWHPNVSRQPQRLSTAAPTSLPLRGRPHTSFSPSSHPPMPPPGRTPAPSGAAPASTTPRRVSRPHILARAHPPFPPPSPPLAPQHLSFKDKAVRLQSKDDMVAVKEEAACGSEKEALKEVRGCSPLAPSALLLAPPGRHGS